MNTQPNDGGPAFPISHPGITPKNEIAASQMIGMTLRDYFAGQALQGILSNPSFDSITPREYASDAYGLADSMLAARERKEGDQ